MSFAAAAAARVGSSVRAMCAPHAGRTPSAATSSRLDPYKLHLEHRFAEGCTSITRLHHRLLADNALGTHQMVRAHIPTRHTTLAGTPLRPPMVRQVTGRWLTRHATALKDVPARCPEPDTTAGHVCDFGEILTRRLGRLGATSA